MVLTKEDWTMARKRHTAEEIVAKLRQVDVLMAQGKPVADAMRKLIRQQISFPSYSAMEVHRQAQCRIGTEWLDFQDGLALARRSGSSRNFSACLAAIRSSAMYHTGTCS
jgi:hypothetical protein